MDFLLDSKEVERYKRALKKAVSSMSTVERNVFWLNAMGLTQKEIAKKINRSVQTVGHIQSRVYRVFELDSRKQRLSWYYDDAVQFGFLEGKGASTDKGGGTNAMV